MNATEVEVIRHEVMTLPDRAEMIVIKDQESMTRGNEFFLVIKGLRKKIADTMDPIISAAFAAHKVAVGKKKELEAPLILAETYVNGKMAAYHQEQKRIRQAEVERLRLIAIKEEEERRKKVEEERMVEAQALEAAGDKTAAEQVMAEVIQNTEAPVIIEQPQPTTPKVEMHGMAMQTYYHFDILNESLIPREYLMPNESRIGAVVRSSKGKITIPGIRVWSDTRAKSTGR